MNNNWFEIWRYDAESMIETMVRNMVSDIENGYNPVGPCIMRQNAAITQYKKAYDNQMKKFRDMTEQQVQHYCYIDLLRRGVIL